MSTRAGEFRRGWGVVLAGFVGIMLGVAPIGTTYTLGVLAKPLSELHGWSRSDVMFATIAAAIGMLPASFAAGWIADRFGVRRVVMLGQIGLALSFIALGTIADTLAKFYTIYALMHVVAAGTAFVTFAKSISAWFEEGRGLALGLALAGTGACGFVVPSYVTWFLEHYDVQTAYFALAALPILIALPVVALLLREPTDAQVRGNSGGAPQTTPAMSGLTRGEALLAWRFWIMSASFFVISFTVTGCITSLVPLLTDSGYTSMQAAEMAGIIGISVIIGRIAVGQLVDRFWGPGVGFIFLTIPCVACFVLAHPELGFWPVMIGIACLGIATGAEIDLNAYLTSRYFGNRAFGQIYALQYIVIAVGAGVSAPAFAAIHDRTGSYDLMLYTGAGLFVLGATSLLLLGRYPRWQ